MKSNIDNINYSIIRPEEFKYCKFVTSAICYNIKWSFFIIITIPNYYNDYNYSFIKKLQKYFEDFFEKLEFETLTNDDHTSSFEMLLKPNNINKYLYLFDNDGYPNIEKVNTFINDVCFSEK